jgi:hypothetical protein
MTSTSIDVGDKKMKVEYIRAEKDITEELRKRNIELYDSHYAIYGYNKIVAVIYDDKSSRFIIKRFDGQMICVSWYETLIDIYHSINTLLGDIVNLEISNDEIGTDKVKITNHHCIPLKKYYPTLSSITRYLFSLSNQKGMIDNSLYNTASAIDSVLNYYMFGGTIVSIVEYMQNRIVSGLNKETFNGIKAKLNMIGVSYIDVDINTIMSIDSKQDLKIYTMQPGILTKYQTMKSHTIAKEQYSSTKYEGSIRNYLISDIPKSAFDKYLYRNGKYIR